MDGERMDREIGWWNGGTNMGMDGHAGLEAKFIVVDKIMV